MIFTLDVLIYCIEKRVNVHVISAIVIIPHSIYISVALTWLKYCQYGVKPNTSNLYISRDGGVVGNSICLACRRFGVQIPAVTDQSR